MIKFFRKIRQKLLAENKLSKYLVYAVGEIILVVIGILIALQINNWNEERKDLVKEQAILSQLQQDYQANLDQLDQKMATREEILTAGFRLLRAFDDREGVVRENVIKDLAIVRNDPTFDPIQNDLTNSENLRLIRNAKLKRLLSNWSSDVVAVTEIEVVWTQKVVGQFDPIISELGLGRDVYNSFVNDVDHYWLLDKNVDEYKDEIGPSRLGPTLNEILSSKELESIVTMSIANNKGAKLQSEALRHRILEILSLIEEGMEEE